MAEQSIKPLRIRIFKTAAGYSYELLKVSDVYTGPLGGRVKVMDYSNRLFYMNRKGGIHFVYRESTIAYNGQPKCDHVFTTNNTTGEPRSTFTAICSKCGYKPAHRPCDYNDVNAVILALNK